MLLRGTAIVSILTLLSRILGFVRDLLVARLLGTSLFADAFFVAFRIPNLLRSFVAEGALTSAFTPVFASSLAEGPDHAKQVMRRITGFLLVMTGSMTLLLVAFSKQVVSLLAPGFEQNEEQFTLCVTLTRTMAPYVMCVSLIAMVNAALNTKHIFGTSAWAQVIMNLVLIVGALVAIPFDPRAATIILSVSVLLGGLVQILAQIPATRRATLSLLPSGRILSREVKEVIVLMLPATLGASVYQVTIFIATILASLLPTGSVSWLFYADRVAQFPIGIFSIALASVLLPALSSASARADVDGFRRNIANSLRFTSFFIIPMSAGIWSLALPITEILFERGAFSHESSVKTAYALQALCLGLWASSCHSMVIRGFIAKKDTVTPTIIGVVSLTVNVVFSLLLMGAIVPGHASGRAIEILGSVQAILLSVSPLTTSLGHVGLALASSIASLVSLGLSISIFRVRVGAFPWDDFLAASGKSLLASLIMVFAIQTSESLVHSPLPLCLLGGVVGVATYCGALYAIRSRELLDTLVVIRNTLASRAE